MKPLHEGFVASGTVVTFITAERERFIGLVTTATTADKLSVRCATTDTDTVVTVMRRNCSVGSGFLPGEIYRRNEPSCGNKPTVLYTLTGAYKMQVQSATCINGIVVCFISIFFCV